MLPETVWKTMLLLLCSLVLGIFLFQHYDVASLVREGFGYVEAMGPSAAALFTAFFILAPFVLVPISLLSMGAGFLFGFIPGLAITIFAASLSSIIGFLLGRYLMREWVVKRSEKNRNFRILDHAVHQEGWKVVALFRFVPMMPFTPMNCFLGSTKITLHHYLTATVLAMMPGLAFLVFLGSIAVDITGLKENYAFSTVQWISAGVFILAAIGTTFFFVKRAYHMIEHKFE